MEKKIGYIICFLVVLNANAQKSGFSFKEVDSSSYALFLKQDWKTLITYGRNSKKEGVDFYYLKVRMGIAYFKEGKMLTAMKYLEEAYELNPYDVVVQDYLYWTYRYTGMFLESDVFYEKMDETLKENLNHKLKFVSAIDVGVVATSNSDYDAMLGESNNDEISNSRIIPKNYQLFTLGLNHRFSKSTNFYHRVTVMPFSSVLQQNVDTGIENYSFQGTETRYYADATFVLGGKWYLDAYLGLFFGSFDKIDLTSETPVNLNEKTKYTDVLFGASVSKLCYYFRNSANISYSNLGEFNQFQLGYTLSLYPLGNSLLVPFGSIQYQNESVDSINESRVIYTGGISLNTKDVTLTGYVNSGEMHNFNSNNASVIYNQSAMGLNEYGAILQVYINKATIKVGYSYMNMKDYYFSEEGFNSTHTFNQQNLIAGFIWNL